MTVAYSPTTWNTNDVITKDRLNKIEQGINTASKLSGTDIDTDKDWGGKSITNIGTIEATQIGTNIYRLIPTDSHTKTLYQNTTQITKNGNGSWQDMRSVTVPANQSGVVRVYFRHRDMGSWRVAVNGVPVPGTETTGSGDHPIDHSHDIYVSGGDVITIQFNTTVYTIYFHELAVYGIPIPDTAGVAW